MKTLNREKSMQQRYNQARRDQRFTYLLEEMSHDPVDDNAEIRNVYGIDPDMIPFLESNYQEIIRREEWKKKTREEARRLKHLADLAADPQMTLPLAI